MKCAPFCQAAPTCPSGLHAAIRFTELEPLADYHPAFTVNPDAAVDDEPSEDSARVTAALTGTARLFVAAGWDSVLVPDCVEYIAYRLDDRCARGRTPLRCCARIMPYPECLVCGHVHGLHSFE